MREEDSKVLNYHKPLTITEMNRLAYLEKENTELKEKLEIEQNARGDWFGKAVTKDRRLTEAKELLNEFMRISKASDEDFEHDYSELIGETEQFLNSEVEK